MAEEYYEPVHLRVEPQAIPELRAAFDRALAILSRPLEDLGRVGRIDGAWMGDPRSIEVAAAYNDHVMKRSDGQYQALLRYQEELQRVRDQLKLLQSEYERTEDDIAGTFLEGAL